MMCAVLIFALYLYTTKENPRIILPKVQMLDAPRCHHTDEHSRAHLFFCFKNRKFISVEQVKSKELKEILGGR